MGSLEVIGDPLDEDDIQPSKDDGEFSSSNRELMDSYDSNRLMDILKQWYVIDINSRLEFPESFNVVPAQFSANKIWSAPMPYLEISRRLLGERENVGTNQLPPEIIRYFSEIVEFSSKQFVDLQQQLIDNEHHIQVLTKAKEDGKVPCFLMLETPEVRFLKEDPASATRQIFRKILDKASSEMLEGILNQRHLLRARLCKEAETLLEVVKTEAADKWIEAQSEWNGWDHFYPISASVTVDGNHVRTPIPLSALIFRTAMKSCNVKVSTLLEARRRDKAEEAHNRRKERRLRREALEKASALPRQEAEKNLMQQMQDLIKPLVAKVSSLEERLQGNRSAPMAADSCGAATKSAKHSRSEGNHPEASDERQAVFVARRGEMKRPRSSEEAIAEDKAQVPPAPHQRGGSGNILGLKRRSGKPWRRKSRGPTGNDQE